MRIVTGKVTLKVRVVFFREPPPLNLLVLGAHDRPGSSYGNSGLTAIANSCADLQSQKLCKTVQSNVQDSEINDEYVYFLPML